MEAVILYIFNPIVANIAASILIKKLSLELEDEGTELNTTLNYLFGPSYKNCIKYIGPVSKESLKTFVPSRIFETRAEVEFDWKNKLSIRELIKLFFKQLSTNWFIIIKLILQGYSLKAIYCYFFNEELTSNLINSGQYIVTDSTKNALILVNDGETPKTTYKALRNLLDGEMYEFNR